MKKALLLLLLPVLAIMLGCTRQETPEKIQTGPRETAVPETEAPAPETATDAPTFDPMGQLYCTTESRESAEEIAQLYGIRLIHFDEGVAIFYTEEDPRTVIRRGEEAGLPRLSLNRTKRFS